METTPRSEATISTSRLDSLGPAEFADEMRESLWQDATWEAFLAPEVIDRTLDAVESLRASIQGQLDMHGGGDRNWAGRARRYVTVLSARHGQVRRVIRNMNRAETAEVSAMDAKWASFAMALAEAVEGSSADDALDVIRVRGELSARDWLGARRVQQAKKARRNDEEF